MAVALWARVAVVLLFAALVASNCGDDLSPTRPSGPSIDGTYTLNLQTTCAAVPADHRSRKYIATITGSPNATVTLAGATFWQHPLHGLQNKLFVSVTGRQLSFNIEPNAEVIEQTAQNTYFRFRGGGTGEMAVDPFQGGVREISGALAGPAGFGEDLFDPSRHADCPFAQGLVTLRLIRTDAPAPPPGIAHSISRVELAGPASLAPGRSAQFSVVAHLTDGSTREVTEGVTWRTSNTVVLRPGNTGEVVGGRVGEANITATVARPNVFPVSTEREVIVVPDGTFRVIGQVTATDAPTSPVHDARVEVAAGPAAGLATSTDWDGRFRLYGVPAGAEIRVSRDGYLSRVLQLSAEHQSLNVTLTLSQPRSTVSGAYTLTVTADCRIGSGSLAPELRERKYTAAIAQSGSDLTVTLSGATFQVGNQRGNTFKGRVDSTRASFLLSFSPYNYWPPDVFELLSDQTVLSVGGNAITTVSSTSLSGTLDGWFTRRTGLFGNWLEGCYSANHGFTLTR